MTCSNKSRNKRKNQYCCNLKHMNLIKHGNSGKPITLNSMRKRYNKRNVIREIILDLND